MDGMLDSMFSWQQLNKEVERDKLWDSFTYWDAQNNLAFK